MGQGIVRFGELKVEKFDTGLVNSWITFSPLLFQTTLVWFRWGYCNKCYTNYRNH